jgi:hypothetical protein
VTSPGSPISAPPAHTSYRPIDRCETAALSVRARSHRTSRPPTQLPGPAPQSLIDDWPAPGASSARTDCPYE